MSATYRQTLEEGSLKSLDLPGLNGNNSLSCLGKRGRGELSCIKTLLKRFFSNLDSESNGRVVVNNSGLDKTFYEVD